MPKFLKNPLFLIALILLVDQLIKLWVKTHMMLGEEIHVAGNWFIIHFTENNGMAFGMELGGETGKLLLSIFRVLAIGGLGYYLFTLVRKKEKTGYIICMSLIFAGAFGNLIDSLFYGLIFNDSYGQVATLFPQEGGYAPFLQGKVVDMFYFPMVQGHFPQWFPFWGGEDFEFFRPVFNLADASISFGVLFILLYQKRFFSESKTAIQEDVTVSNENKEEAVQQ